MLIYSPQMHDDTATVWEPEDCLDVYPLSDRFRCVGTLDSGKRCAGTLIPPANHREARVILDDLKTAPINLIVSGGWLFPELHRLATLTLCSERHRYDCVWHPSWRIGKLYQPEAVLVAHEWFNTIRDMPSRQAIGGLRRHPAIPESISNHIITSTQNPVFSQRGQRSALTPSTENTHSESQMSGPPFKTFGDLPAVNTTLTPPEHISVQGDLPYAFQDPFTFDLYSATPPLGAQLPVSSTQIPETGTQRTGMPAHTLSFANTHPASNTKQSQRNITQSSMPPSVILDNTSTLPLADPSPAMSIQSMTHSSSGNTRVHTPQSPLSREGTQHTPTGPHGLIPSLPAVISNAVITALSSPASLEDALKDLLSETNGRKH